MNVKWYGTAIISMTAADETILFDPFISLNDAGRSDLDDFTLHFIRRIKPQAVFLQHFDDSFPPVSNQTLFLDLQFPFKAFHWCYLVLVVFYLTHIRCKMHNTFKCLFQIGLHDTRDD